MNFLNRATAQLGCIAIVAPVLAMASTATAHEPIHVAYTTSDGVQIHGDYWTPIKGNAKAPVVILLHTYATDRKSWIPQIVDLEYAGFAIMTIDMRGHGESVKPKEMNLVQRHKDRDPKLYNAMHKDVAGAYEWLTHRKEVDLSRVALIGGSVGSSVAMDYASRDKSVDVVAVLSPGPKYLGINSLPHYKAYGPRPVLILSSEQEKARGVDPLLKQAKAGGVLVETKIYDQTGIHGHRMYGKVKGVSKKVAAYLKLHIGESSNDMVYAVVGGETFFEKGNPGISAIAPGKMRVFSSKAEAMKRGLLPAPR